VTAVPGRLTVPGPLVFGGAPIGRLYAPVSGQAAAATLAAAWDAGIRAFGTTPHYGVGLSEQRIGDFLAGYRREEFVVSTKVGLLLVPAEGSAEGVDEFYGTPALSRLRDYSPDGVLRSLEDSLRRLRLDRVEIALIHDPDDHRAEALDGAYAALARLRADGTVRAIVVVASPGCPGRPAGSGLSPRVLGGVRVEARRLPAAVTATTRTGADCRYSLRLAPGRYVLNVATGRIFPRCPQVTVSVRSARPVRADMTCDSGIR
jgi:hypothetical protein